MIILVVIFISNNYILDLEITINYNNNKDKNFIVKPNNICVDDFMLNNQLNNDSCSCDSLSGHGWNIQKRLR